jgi:hypothetical protein
VKEGRKEGAPIFFPSCVPPLGTVIMTDINGCNSDSSSGKVESGRGGVKVVHISCPLYVRHKLTAETYLPCAGCEPHLHPSSFTGVKVVHYT